MKLYLCILCCCFAFSRTTPLEDSREFVEPEYLDLLLKEKNYEEFNRLMGIDIPHLSRPRTGNETHHPRFSPYLEHGDILLTPKQKEEARQGVRNENLKWPNTRVAYYLSNDHNKNEKTIITNGIRKFNAHVNGCIRLDPYRRGDKDYIYFYKGEGCWSNLGRAGGQQSLSLDDGCVDEATVIHETMHAVGFYHEHCRPDRDQYIEMKWNNINKDWQSQFYKASSEDASSYGDYDIYSVMHYPISHPDVSNNRRCFDVIGNPNVDERAIGYAKDATETDAAKLQNMYCKA